MTDFPKSKGKSIFITDTKYRMIFVLGVPLFGFLVTIIYPNIANYSDYRKVEMARVAINKFRDECSRYPESLDLLTITSHGCQNSAQDPYLTEVPQDHRGRKLFYEQNIINFVIKVDDSKPSGLGVINDGVDTK